jgi:glycosyltransferase involved in cell wall biosynthesis
MEQERCKVSIIIPVYNAQLFLDRCVTSVLAQTLCDTEIILVNDGSTDQSGNMCDAYAMRDTRIRVLHLQNGGPAWARNQGIRVAQGKYIGFVDADDYVDHSMFELLYETAERTRSDIYMCNYAVDQSGTVHPAVMDYEPLYLGPEIKTGVIRRYYSGDHNGLYSMCNKLFRRSFIADNSIKINEKLRRGEDAWFVFDCLKAAEVVSFIPKVLYYYYQNSASIMHSLSKDQFEKWTYSRNRLLEENKQLQLTIDWNLFYKDYLYKTVCYCREMVCRNEIALVKSVFEDATYIRALSYRAELPAHIRFLLWLTEKKHYQTAIIVYRLWSLGK